MTILEADHIQKRFAEKMVLKDISFSIEKPEIFGLLGPSGSGKTTLIRILLGLLKKDGGSSYVLGNDSGHLSDDTYAQIGMMLDEAGLYDRLSCIDNLDIYRRLYQLPYNVIEPALRRVSLYDSRQKAVIKLSKGMKQRLSFARALLHEPRVLFLDEPTSGLDPATTSNIHELLFELKEKGVTIFLTTHDMEEATRLCDRVAFLNEGSIIECDTPEAICCKYNTTNQVNITTAQGESIVLDIKRDAVKIMHLMESGHVKTIHSMEPTLETVFITLTGKELV